MSGACPKCGGTSRTLLAPGFFKCASPVVRGVVPVAGAGGFRYERPVTGPCGHEYQEGPAPTSGPSCSCGLFAIGSCRICGKPRCGRHSSQQAGSLVCDTHIAEANAIAAEKARRQHEQEVEEAKQAVAEEARAVSQALGGFPEAPAAGEDLARALQRLVPERIERLDGGKKTFGRKRIAGWCFLVASEPNLEVASRFDLRHLLVARDGRTWLLSSPLMISTDYHPRSVAGEYPYGAVMEEYLRPVRDQVFAWTGIPKPPETSARQRELVEQQQDLEKRTAAAIDRIMRA